MEYEKYYLQNGLKVILKHKDTKSIHIQININAGSINEELGEKGYSHLVEHMLFEGTKKRQNAQIICSEIENLGGEINAATSNEETLYYIRIPEKHYNKAIDVLSDIIKNPLFAKNTTKKEKQIVLEEIKMVNDQPRYYQWILFEKTLFKGSSHEFPVYGTVKDVTKATTDTIKKYYQKHYYPKNATLVIIGNINNNKEKIKKLIKSKFETWKNNTVIKPQQLIIPDSINKTKFAKEEKDLQQTYLIQGKITPKITNKKSIAIELIEAILGKPQSGRINNEIRTKYGLAYDVTVTYENFKEFGFFAVNIGADSKNIPKIKKILKKQYLLENLTKKELQFAKDYIEGREILELESITNEAEMINFWETVANKNLNDERLEQIKKTTIKEVKLAAKELFKDLTEIQLIPKNI